MPFGAQQPFTYREIQDKYNSLASSRPDLVGGMSMGDFAKHLNQQSGSRLFDAGLNPNVVKDASAGIDRMFDASGVTDLTGGAAKVLGDLYSPEAGQAAEEIGRGLPRVLGAGALGALAGTLVEPGGGTAVGLEGGLEAAGARALTSQAWRMFGSNVGFGANQGLETYTQTDSPLAGAASAALGYLTQGFGATGEKLAAKYIGSKLGSEVGEDGIRHSIEGVLPTLGEMAAEKFGLAAGFTVNNELTRQAVNLSLGQGLTMPSTTDAISDVANAVAPIILGVGHDVMNLREATSGGPRNTRSLSESMNLVEAAQKITTQNIRQDVQRAAEAAQITLDKTKQSDAQRALSLDEDDVSSRVLRPEDSAKYYADVEAANTKPNGLTFLGEPLHDKGSLSNPTNRTEPANEVPQTVPVAEPPAPAQGERPVEQANEAITQENGQRSKPVEPPSTVARPEPAQPATEQVVRQVPVEVTEQTVAQDTKRIPAQPISINQLGDVAELHTQLTKQLADNPSIRDTVSVNPINDDWLNTRIQHLIDNGFSPQQAVTRVAKAAAEQVRTNLSKVNNALFQAREKTQELATGAANQDHSAEFVHNISHDSIYGDLVEEALHSGIDLPLNPTVSIERWVRRSRLNADPRVPEVLLKLKTAHDQLGRRLTEDELDRVLNNTELSDITKSDLRSQFNSIFTRNGTPSGKGHLYQRISQGKWTPDLKTYLETAAERDQLSQTKGRASLDATREGEAESSLSHTDIHDDAGRIAREKHQDPIAAEVSQKHAEERIDKVQKFVDMVSKMSPDTIGRIAQKANITTPKDIESYKQKLTTYMKGVMLHPEARWTADGKGRDRGGLYKWLMEGEEGSHVEFKGTETNLTTLTQHMDRWLKTFYDETHSTFDNVDAKPEQTIDAQGKVTTEPQAVRKPVVDDKSLQTDEKGYVITSASNKNKQGGVRIPTKFSHTTYAKAPNAETLAFSTFSWFHDYFKESGLDENSPLFKRYVESASRLAHLFPKIERTRVSSLVKEAGATKGDTGIEGLFFTAWGANARSGKGQADPYTKFMRFVAMKENHYTTVENDAFLKSLTLVHEFNHVVFDAARKGELPVELKGKMDDALHVASQMSYEDRMTILSSLTKGLVPAEIRRSDKPQDRELQDAVAGFSHYGASGGAGLQDEPEEFLSTVMQYIGVGIANPAKSKEGLRSVHSVMETFDLVPDYLREFKEAYYTNLLEYTNALKGYFNEHTPGLGESYLAMADAVKAMTKPSKFVQEAVDNMNVMASMQPEQFVQLANDAKGPDAIAQTLRGGRVSVALVGDLRHVYGLDVKDQDVVRANRMLKEVRETILPDPKMAPVYGHNPGFWSLFTPLAQFAERYPVMRPLADTLLSFDGMVNNANTLAMSPFGTREINGKLVKTENLDSLKRLANNPLTHDLLNKLFLWANKNEKEITPDVVAKFGPSLSEQQRTDVMNTVRATSTALQTVGQGTVANSLHMTGHLVGALAMKTDPTMTAKTGEQLGLNLMKALIGMRSPDPQTVMQSQELLGGVKMQLAPEAWTNVLQAAQTLAEKHGQLIDKLSNRPWYTPETRPYEFGLYYEKNGAPVFTSFKSGPEAIAAHEKISKQPGVTKAELTNPYDQRSPGAQYSEAAVMHFIDLEKSAFEAAKNVYGNDPDKLAQFSQLYTPGRAVLEELGSRGIRKNMQERKFIGGREDIDMLSNSLNYISAMNRANARNYIRSKSLLQAQDPTLTNEPRLMNLYTDHMNNVLNPPSQSIGWLKQLTSVYYLGGNFSSAALQSLQNVQMTLPHLTRQGVSYTDGIKYLVDASKEVFNALGMKKGFSDPVLAAAHQKAMDSRVVGSTNIMNKFDHVDDAFVARLKNFSNDSGNANISPEQLLQNGAYHATRVLQYMFNKANDINSHVSFVMGFKAAMKLGSDKGLVGKDLADYAYGEAKRTTEVTQLTGGVADRPLGFGKLGGLYGLAGNMYALNHYNFSSIAMMARYGLEAIGHTGLEGAALHNARKAFAQMFTTQLALAGALGLPFAGAAVAVAEQLFPNLQLNKDMREGISNLAGQDHELGGFLADASLKGLATAFSPVDLSGRLGMSAILGQNPYYGFNAQDLLGATGSMLANFTKGVQGVSSGEPSAAAYFMPSALQGMYKAVTSQGVKDRAGNLVFQPTETQRVLQAVGLRPKEMSAAQEQLMIDNRSQTIQSRELQRWYQTQEEALKVGNYEAVKSALYQKAQEDPTFSPIVALKRIVAGVQKAQIPVAPSDRGSARLQSERDRVAQSFGAPTNQQTAPSQVSQLLARAQLARQVGLPGAGQVLPGEVSRAQTLDYLMMHYHLNENQARALVTQIADSKNPRFQQFHQDQPSPLEALSSSQPQ